MTSAIARSSSPTSRRRVDVLRPERDRRRGQRHRGRDDGVPALAEIGGDALVEQALHVVLALRVGRGVPRVHRGAVDAAVEARRRGGGQLALGPRQAGIGVVEDVLVGPRAGLAARRGRAPAGGNTATSRARRRPGWPCGARSSPRSASGSSQGSQSSMARVKAAGTVCGGGRGPCRSCWTSRLGGGQDAQAGDHPDLEGQEGDDLRERHDVGRWTSRRPAAPAAPPARRRAGGRPAGARARTPRRGAGPARRGSRRRRDRSARPCPRGSAARRDSGRRGPAPWPPRSPRRPRRAVPPARRAAARPRGVERRDRRLAVQAGDEGGHREALAR